MERSDSVKSAAPSTASTDGSYDLLPVVSARHVDGGDVDGADTDGEVADEDDHGGINRTTPTPEHLGQRESAVPYHQDLKDWHSPPQCDNGTDRDQLHEELESSASLGRDEVRADSSQNNEEPYRPPTPFPLVSSRSETSQESTDHPKAANSDGTRSSHESEAGGGDQEQSHSPPSSDNSNDNALLQPHTLALPFGSVGRRKLVSARQVLFATPTRAGMQAAPSLEKSSPGWMSAPPAITVSPPRESIHDREDRRRDGRRAATEGDDVGLFSGHLDTHERSTEQAQRQQRNAAPHRSWSQQQTAGPLNEKKGDDVDETRRAEQQRTLSLSEFYSTRRDGDEAKRK